MFRKQTRGKKGAIMGFVAALTILFCMLGAGIFALLMAFSGGHQMQHAVEAGTLAVAQHALTLPDRASDSDKSQFSELSHNGKFYLGNVNRAIAKSLLISANAADMRARGYGHALADQHARDVEKSAQRIADSLKQEVTKAGNLDKTFTDYANSNSLRMLMPNAQVAIDGVVQTAYLDKEVQTTESSESNVYFNPRVLPESQKSAFATTPVSGKSYIKGYTDQPNRLSSLRLIPFRRGERTALVSGSHFFAPQAQSPDSRDVPNAWAYRGKAQIRTGSWLSNIAMAQANQKEEFDLRATNSWIRIKLYANKLEWYLPAGRRSDTYPFNTFLKFESFMVPAGGTGTSTATVGAEYVSPTLWDVLFPPSASRTETVKQELIARLREMQPELTDDQLTQPLKSTTVQTFITSDQTFYVYPGNNKNILVSSSAPSHVKQSVQPDGKAIRFDEAWSHTPDANAQFMGNKCTIPIVATDLKGYLKWHPGTGYDGCLGQIEASRTTTVKIRGSCQPPSP